MIQNVLQEIGGVGAYGVISICLFFLVFSGALLLACRHQKSFLEAMSQLPLQDGEPHPVTEGDQHHERTE